MRQHVIAVLLVWALVLPLFGEEVLEPEDPEILAPELVLEIEDLSSEDISAPLPGSDELPLPSFPLPQPEPELVELESVKVDIPLPLSYLPEDSEESSFYSEALLGGGINNQLVGDIALFRIGSGPRYSLRYLHEGIDGYGQEASGTGFFDRKDRLFADFSAELFPGDRGLGINAEGFYEEKEIGLQEQQLKAESIIQRASAISLSLRYPERSSLVFEFSALLSNSRRLYRGLEGGEQSAFSVRPTCSLVYRGQHSDASLSGSYLYRGAGAPEQRHQLGADTSFVYRFPALDLSLQAGILWSRDLDLVFPFSLQLDGTLGDRVRWSGSGGYECIQKSRYELWDHFAFWSSPGPPRELERWFSRGSVEFRPVEVYTLQGAWEFLSGDLEPELSNFQPDLTAAVAPYVPLSREGAAFSYELATSWEPMDALKFHGGWRSFIGEKPQLYASRAAVFGSVDYSFRDGAVDASLQISTDLLDDHPVPLFDLSLAWRISDGVQASLEGTDLLSPFLDQGRVYQDRFIRPGAVVQANIKISL